MKRPILLTVLFTLLLTISAQAQLEIGASYELRNETPENGFGLYIQKPFLDLPLLDFGVRAHASFFSEENSVSTTQVSYTQDFSSYDFGIAAYGGLSLGLLEPYVGVGLGSESFNLDLTGVTSDQLALFDLSEGDESNIYWNTFIGAKVTIIPLVKPFVEYRYSDKQIGSPTLAGEQNQRIVFGVFISF